MLALRYSSRAPEGRNTLVLSNLCGPHSDDANDAQVSSKPGQPVRSRRDLFLVTWRPFYEPHDTIYSRYAPAPLFYVYPTCWQDRCTQGGGTTAYRSWYTGTPGHWAWYTGTPGHWAWYTGTLGLVHRDTEPEPGYRDTEPEPGYRDTEPGSRLGHRARVQTGTPSRIDQT